MLPSANLAIHFNEHVEVARNATVTLTPRLNPRKPAVSIGLEGLVAENRTLRILAGGLLDRREESAWLSIWPVRTRQAGLISEGAISAVSTTIVASKS